MNLIGVEIHGYCGGYFEDDYTDEPRRIEAAGKDWIVARPLRSGSPPSFVSFESEEQMITLIKEWMTDDKN